SPTRYFQAAAVRRTRTFEGESLPEITVVPRPVNRRFPPSGAGQTRTRGDRWCRVRLPRADTFSTWTPGSAVVTLATSSPNGKAEFGRSPPSGSRAFTQVRHYLPTFE